VNIVTEIPASFWVEVMKLLRKVKQKLEEAEVEES
jgi:hypothetical protein